jgi:hypothetical protein
MTSASPSDTPEMRQLRNRVARTRTELRHTVEALVEKTDVKARSAHGGRRLRQEAANRWRGLDSRAVAAGAMARGGAAFVDGVFWFARRRSAASR